MMILTWQKQSCGGHTGMALNCWEQKEDSSGLVFSIADDWPFKSWLCQPYQN